MKAYIYLIGHYDIDKGYLFKSLAENVIVRCAFEKIQKLFIWNSTTAISATSEKKNLIIDSV